MNKVALPLLALVACGGAGWMVAGLKESTRAESRPETNAVTRSERPASGSKTGRLPEEVLRLLAPVRSARTPEERMRATILLARNLPVSELEQWHRHGWFGLPGSPEARIFTDITYGRWLAAEPAELMEFLIRRGDPELGTMSMAWGENDPEAALSFLRNCREKDHLFGMASPLLTKLAKSDPALLVSHLDELHGLLGTERSDLIARTLVELAKSSPNELEQASKEWPAPLQKMAQRQLMITGLGQDFHGAIASLFPSPDGKQRFLDLINDSGEAAQSAVDHAETWPEGWLAEAAMRNPQRLVTGKNPERWLEMDLAALGLDEATARNIRQRAIQQYAMIKPIAALPLVLEHIEDPKERQRPLETIFRMAAAAKQTDAEALFATLTDESDRKLARSILDAPDNNMAPDQPAPSNPAQWLEKVGSINPGNAYRVGNEASQWSREEIDSARAGFQQLPTDQKAKVAVNLAADMFSAYHPQLCADAVAYLIANPQERPTDQKDSGFSSPLRSASVLAARWGKQDPVAAGIWVQSLPAGEERTWAAKNLAGQWAEYEPSAARKWAASLPPGDRAEVETFLKESGAGKR